MIRRRRGSWSDLSEVRNLDLGMESVLDLAVEVVTGGFHGLGRRLHRRPRPSTSSTINPFY